MCPKPIIQNAESTTLPAINSWNFTLPCRGNRAPATISRLSVEVLRLCKEIDCFYECDKRELSPISLCSSASCAAEKKENIQRSTLRLLILMISAELQELNAEC